MSGLPDAYQELIALTARAVCNLEGVSPELKDELEHRLESTRFSARPGAVRDAAHTAPGRSVDPFTGMIDNSIEQIIEEHADLVGDDLEAVALIRAAIERGIEIANTRLGDLA